MAQSGRREQRSGGQGGRGTWIPGTEGKVPFPMMTYSTGACISYVASESNEQLQVVKGEGGRGTL